MWRYKETGTQHTLNMQVGTNEQCLLLIQLKEKSNFPCHDLCNSSGPMTKNGTTTIWKVLNSKEILIIYRLHVFKPKIPHCTLCILLLEKNFDPRYVCVVGYVFLGRKSLLMCLLHFTVYLRIFLYSHQLQQQNKANPHPFSLSSYHNLPVSLILQLRKKWRCQGIQ